MDYLNPQRDASLSPCLAIPPKPKCRRAAPSSRRHPHRRHVLGYLHRHSGGGARLDRERPEHLYYKYTAVQGYLTATLTYIEPGQDLDVFIVQDSDREPPAATTTPPIPSA